MDETLLCLLEDYEVAKEVVRHFNVLNSKIAESVDNYLNKLLCNNWEVISPSIEKNFLVTKKSWIDANDDWLACFSFDVDANEDDYDVWLNHLLGYSKYPFNITCSFNGLLQCIDIEKSTLIEASIDLKTKLLSIGYSESIVKSKKYYYFTKPIKFEKQDIIKSFEDGTPEDGMIILSKIVKEMDELVPLIGNVLDKFIK